MQQECTIREVTFSDKFSNNIKDQIELQGQIIKEIQDICAYSTHNMRDMKGEYRILIGNCNGRDNLEDLGIDRQEDNIKINLTEIKLGIGPNVSISLGKKSGKLID